MNFNIILEILIVAFAFIAVILFYRYGRKITKGDFREVVMGMGFAIFFLAIGEVIRLSTKLFVLSEGIKSVSYIFIICGLVILAYAFYRGILFGKTYGFVKSKFVRKMRGGKSKKVFEHISLIL
ncbi:hypothetical protein J4226_05030 [Candidatus Pacearchaeota archaeon]|nr:hypothetical protein [Candidatus Pacearchaeota archaeon]